MALAAANAVDLVPFCTCATGGDASELRLRGAGIDLLEGAKFSSRKVALLGVLQLQDGGASFPGERGLYITRNAVGVADADAAALLCVLRGVDLRDEPFWGCLLLLLSSHVFLASQGPVTAASLGELAFLADFAQIQVLGEDADADGNTRLLQAFMPKLTWVAVDLKIKEMDGCESPAKYFEQRLAALASTISSASEDVAAQQHALLLTSLAKARDCIVVKSNMMSTPEGFAAPQAFTSSKIVAHATDGGAGLQPKAFFGRFLDGSQLLHLARSLAHAVGAARSTTLVLKRLVSNVLANYWKLLVASALEKYTDEIHARLVVYERVPITGEYLIDVTERKLSKFKTADKQAAGSVVNAGQGNFSVFDEFGNLKRQPAQAPADSASSSSTAPSPALNTGIFSFIKNRAGRAFTKQFSLFPATPPSRKATPAASAELGFIAEDQDDEDGEGGVVSVRKASVPVESPDDVLAKCTTKIKSYSVSLEYVNTPSEAMPVDATTLERIHGDALAKAMQLLTPFLVDLRCPSTVVTYSELACPLDFVRGKKKLLARINKVRARFERANDVSSAIFCAELLRYLHSVVLRKSETDNEVAQKRQQRMAKGGSGNGASSAPMNKLPLELLTYKTNLEAMVSQYNFVARGPCATAVLIGFFQGPVRQRLSVLAQHEYDRFAHACDERLESITALEDSLQDKQRQVAQITSTTTEWSRQEAEAIADVERAHSEKVAQLRGEIQRASERVERALADQQALYQSTMHATRRTINTIDKVAEKSRMVSGYLERYEKGHMFTKSWRQYFYVLDHATLTCYRSKSVYEERGAPCETPIVLTGYRVERSRTDDLKIKLLPPEAGRSGMLRFRAPASVGRETWVKRFVDATQLSASPSR